MSFGAPWWLWALAAVGVFALILVLIVIGRQARAGGGVRWPRISRVVASGSGVRAVRAGRTVRRPWLLLFALSGVILALARPRWGTIDEPVVEQSREVMIALDLSRSMLVEDILPSRLERAKLLAKSLLDNLRGERVGVIVFAGTAFVQVPLSADYQIIHDFLPELKPDYMPQGGTDYEGMLRSALGGFGHDTNVDRFLLVLSDGEAHSATWRDHLPELRERGVHAITLGLGTPKGGFIPDGKQSYLKDERGAVVLSKLEPATLQALASETRGVFRNASEWIDVSALIEGTVARSRAGSFETRRQARYLEQFQWFLAPAVVFAMLGLWREIAVRPRQQTVRRAPPLPAKVAASVAATLVILTLASTDTWAAETAKPPDAPDARVRETITRLATTPSPTARDWRELADRTLVYATGARVDQQPVETGAVYDALEAVDRGERADPKLTDWKKLRDDLRATLDLPPQQQPPPQEKKPDEPPPKKNEQDQQQKQQQDEQQDQSRPQSSEQKNEQDQQQQQQQEKQETPQSTKPEESKPTEGQMGQLKPESGEPPPNPPRPEEANTQPPKTRKIGAKPATEPPPENAEAAVLLQRLRQAAEHDSPARLFELLEGDDKQPAERGRDW